MFWNGVRMIDLGLENLSPLQCLTQWTRVYLRCDFRFEISGLQMRCVLPVKHFLSFFYTKREVGRSTRDSGCPAGVTYQGAFAHPPTALLHVPPQSGSPTWGKGAVAASSTLQRVLPREVTHVRPKSHIPLPRADDTWGRVPPHILINLRILGPRGREPGQRPCPAGTPTPVGFQ